MNLDKFDNNSYKRFCSPAQIEKAVNLRKEGIPLQIIQESDLYDAIEELK